MCIIQHVVYSNRSDTFSFWRATKHDGDAVSLMVHIHETRHIRNACVHDSRFIDPHDWNIQGDHFWLCSHRDREWYSEKKCDVKRNTKTKQNKDKAKQSKNVSLFSHLYISLFISWFQSCSVECDSWRFSFIRSLPRDLGCDQQNHGYGNRDHACSTYTAVCRSWVLILIMWQRSLWIESRNCNVNTSCLFLLYSTTRKLCHHAFVACIYTYSRNSWPKITRLCRSRTAPMCSPHRTDTKRIVLVHDVTTD